MNDQLLTSCPPKHKPHTLLTLEAVRRALEEVWGGVGQRVGVHFHLVVVVFVGLVIEEPVK